MIETIVKPQISPSKKEFMKLAEQGNLIPIFLEMSSDRHTPTSVYKNILMMMDGSEYSFLLESADRTEVVGRYSIIGGAPKEIFRPTPEGDPLEELKEFMSKYKHVPSPKIQGFSGGAVGYLGYDSVGKFEKVPKHKNGKGLGVPEACFMIADKVVVFDHLTKKMRLIVNACTDGVEPEDAYNEAVQDIENLFGIVTLPNILDVMFTPKIGSIPELKSNTPKEEFMSMVTDCKEDILAGDIFQVVLSQRFEIEYHYSPLTLYRMLWMVNPSPYMFCMSFGEEVSIVGSSPEVHVRLTGDKIEIRPIAGTRKRGQTREEDLANEKDLLSDPKEIAEHVMLVDLARNDIGRDSEYGSVKVVDTMSIERFSHVMHIVSSIEGKKRSEKDAYDIMRSTFPAGTVSGAPKIRAMEIIATKEKEPRGIYSGAVGYFGFDGNMDSCIALRTVVLKDEKAYVQAGAGIVTDSTPEGEYQECVNKTMGMLRAIQMAKEVKYS